MARSILEIRKLYPYIDDCVELQKSIEKLIVEKSYYSIKMNSGEILVLDKRLSELNNYFNNINCNSFIGDNKLEQVSEIASKYQEIDKIRIQTENKEQVNKRILIGISIIFAGVGIILITKKK